MARPDAEIIADVLVFADLRGTHSHGVMRLEHYTNRIRLGGINMTPDLRVQSIKPAIGLIDAAGGMGHVAAKRATEEAIGRAKEHGIGLVGVKNSSHCGALAYYIDMALQERLAAILSVNTDKCVIPFGGREPFFGTNPFAFGFPGLRQSILLDMATSEVAFGKIFYAQRKNTPIPDGWAVDETGTSTTDPHAAYALFPFGGVKGYGINLMVEALTGLLVGGVFGPHVKPMYEELDVYRNVSSFHLVIDPSLFNGEAVFSHTQALIDELHAQPATSGSGRLMVPGELEEETMQRSLIEGIAIPESVYRYLADTE
ncbi:MAG: Ldh family oxidoreductase [Spirochaetales bacterium]|nr:Ldh family oxidoreductase [Spirochaetales bacterium]